MAETLTAPFLSTSALDAPTKPIHVPHPSQRPPCLIARLATLRLLWMPQSTRKSQADEDDAELSEAQTADGQMSNSEGEQGSEHAEPPADAQSDTKKKGRASKSAIGKTAKKPAKQSPTRTRVAGKCTIVAPDICNPESCPRSTPRLCSSRRRGRKCPS